VAAHEWFIGLSLVVVVSLSDIVPRSYEHRKCEASQGTDRSLTCTGPHIRPGEGSRDIRRGVQRLSVALLRQLLAPRAPDERHAQAIPPIDLPANHNDALGHLHDQRESLHPPTRRSHPQMGLCHNGGGLITARFFLGVAEAGLFPGVNVRYQPFKQL
jgi:hypothetical protein